MLNRSLELIVRTFLSTFDLFITRSPHLASILKKLSVRQRLLISYSGGRDRVRKSLHELSSQHLRDRVRR